MPEAADADPLLDLISNTIGADRNRLADGTSLFHDLGVDGLDGADLLDAIGTRYGIDMSDVDWSRYFGPERPYNPLYHLWCLLRGRRLDHGIVPLRISDLRRSIQSGRWQEPGN